MSKAGSSDCAGERACVRPGEGGSTFMLASQTWRGHSCRVCTVRVAARGFRGCRVPTTNDAPTRVVEKQRRGPGIVLSRFVPRQGAVSAARGFSARASCRLTHARAFQLAPITTFGRDRSSGQKRRHEADAGSQKASRRVGTRQAGVPAPHPGNPNERPPPSAIPSEETLPGRFVSPVAPESRPRSARHQKRMPPSQRKSQDRLA